MLMTSGHELQGLASAPSSMVLLSSGLSFPTVGTQIPSLTLTAPTLQSLNQPRHRQDALTSAQAPGHGPIPASQPHQHEPATGLGAMQARLPVLGQDTFDEMSASQARADGAGPGCSGRQPRPQVASSISVLVAQLQEDLQHCFSSEWFG